MRKKKKGLTLVELIAVIAILGIFTTMAMAVTGNLSKGFNNAQKENSFQDSARLIHSYLEDDLRIATKIKINPTVGTGNTINIDGNNYGLSSITDIPVISFINKKGGTLYANAYVLNTATNSVYKLSAPTSNVTVNFNKVTTNFIDIKKFSITHDIDGDGTEDNKGYKVTLEFEDTKGRKDNYENVVVTRN